MPEITSHDLNVPPLIDEDSRREPNFSERKEARRLRREHARAIEQRQARPVTATTTFRERHAFLTTSLLIGGSVLLGAILSRVLLPPRSARESLWHSFTRRLAL